MALRETHIDVDITANADPLRDINRQINEITHNTVNMGNTIGQSSDVIDHHHRRHRDSLGHLYNSYSNLDDHAAAMLENMRRGWRRSRDGTQGFIGDLIQARHNFFQVAESANRFTSDFMGDIDRMGNQMRRAQDAMINNSVQVRQQFYQQIGIMRNMTTQAARIRDEYVRMGNPLYMVNRGGLAAANALNRMANRGTAASLALQRLGPTASMHSLRNMTMMITQGLMRFQMIAIGAAVQAYLFYGALHKMAMENKEYAKSFNTMMATLKKAIQPLVDVFIMIMTPVFNFITAIGKMIVKFNEAHPLISKIIAAVILLVPALTLLLAPLAIGIGLFGGFSAALGALWPIIGPVVTGLAAMMGTVWLVAGAIVGVVVLVVMMYNKFAWFRDGVNAIWNSIKIYAGIAWNWIKQVIMTAVNAIVAFVNPMLAKIKTFWAQNGQQIMMIVRMFMNIIKTVITSQMGYIKGIFQVAWAVISAAVKVAWGLIKIVVSTAMNFILGTIKAVLAVLRGDWQGAWDAIKGIFINTWNDIKSIFQSMDLAQIGKNLINGLISGISSMTGAVRNAVMGIVNSVKNTFTGMLKIHSPSRLFMEYGINTVQGYTMGLDKQQQPLQQATYDMANIPASYTPQSSVTTTNNRSNRSLVFNPTIQVNASQGSDTSVKKQVQEALDEAYSYLQTVYDVGVDY